MSVAPIKNSIIGITQRIINIIPEVNVSGKRTVKVLNWAGKSLSSHHNRLILGATALLTQPFIDLSNKRIDEDTRKVSAARTVAKIIAGTSTGFLVRWGCIKSIDAFTNYPSTIKPGTKFAKLRTLFAPDIVLKNLRYYKNGLGTFVALFAMVFTNFLIDAPVTKYLTNKFVNIINCKHQSQSAEQKIKKGGINE